MVDLHCQFVGDAIHFLAREIALIQSRFWSQKNYEWLVVIVGVGYHSNSEVRVLMGCMIQQATQCNGKGPSR